MKKILKNIHIVIFLIIAAIVLAVSLLAQRAQQAEQPVVLQEAPSKEQLDEAIERGRAYYEDLYRDLGDDGAVIAEYRSAPKSVYTVRHASIGGYYYYDYVGDATRSAKLKQFAENYGFDVTRDAHSFVWSSDNQTSRDYFRKIESYNDCLVDLPSYEYVLPYHSKVCKLGHLGIRAFIAVEEFDPFLNIVDLLNTPKDEELDTDKLAAVESRYREHGMPMCMPWGCAESASAFRTALFGELQLRQGNMEYADSAASNLLKAQDETGAVFLTYDKEGGLDTAKSIFYDILNFFLSDEPVTDDYIPTNSENMSDVLAFLMHYRCEKYNECNE